MSSETFKAWASGGNGAAGPGGYTAPGTSTQNLALDNLIRRELRVTDPSDPEAIARALASRYKDDPRTIAIDQEAQGLPFALARSLPAQVVPASSSSDAELEEALEDVRRDLEELTTNAQLKDVKPELLGWARAVETLMTEGATAARLSADPRQRDKTFAIRRQLGEYARVARLLGAFNPPLSATYRSFAQSLDEIASVFLVMMGESLSNTSSSGGRFLLQMPYTELQARRDAVVASLRNLTGSVQQAYGPGEWAFGLDSYATLVRQLEEYGQGDLRMMLDEGELSRVMDELIQRASHGSSEGLRALGATAQLDLERFRRMTAVGQRLVNKRSPAFTSYLEALQLFADAFNASGGHRLVRVARPPILFYGLYGSSGREDAEQRLVELLINRGKLAALLDQFMECGCTLDSIKYQAIVDKVLYDVDRAIDLYAIGTKNLGQPERRAAVSGYFIHALQELDGEADFSGRAAARLARLARKAPGAPAAGAGPAAPAAPKAVVLGGGGPLRNLGELANVVLDAIRVVLLGPLDDGDQPGSGDVSDSFRKIVQHELSMQFALEKQWHELAKNMVPNGHTFEDVFAAMKGVFDGAFEAADTRPDHVSFDVRFPPTVEEGLERLAYKVDDVADAVNRGARGIADKFKENGQGTAYAKLDGIDKSLSDIAARAGSQPPPPPPAPGPTLDDLRKAGRESVERDCRAVVDRLVEMAKQNKLEDKEFKRRKGSVEGLRKEIDDVIQGASEAAQIAAAGKQFIDGALDRAFPLGGRARAGRGGGRSDQTEEP